MKTAQPVDATSQPSESVRSRIIEATFHALMERGYAGANTREIARRARVSKRELYALFDSKEGILAAMIGGRSARMRQPLALPDVADRDALAAALRRFGVSLLREGSRPEVMALFRLAIAEADRAPGLAHRLDADGRQPTRTALIDFLTRAAERGLISGDPLSIASQFVALLWDDWLMALLLRLAEAPSPEQVEGRAANAVTALLSLYPAEVTPGR